MPKNKHPAYLMTQKEIDKDEEVNPVRKDGALTPPFLLGIEALFILSPP